MSRLDDLLNAPDSTDSPVAAPEAPVQAPPAAAPETPRGRLDALLKDDSGQNPTTPPTKITGDTPWSDVWDSAVEHAPESGMNVLKGIPEAATGAVHLGSELVNPTNWPGLAHSVADSVANTDWKQKGKEFYHDYLTEEGWKQGIGLDPVGRALDVGLALAGPEELAARSGIKGLATVGKVARYADPVNLATGLAGKLTDAADNMIFNIAGSHAGTGTGNSLNALYAAGKEGIKPAWEGLKGLWAGTFATPDLAKQVSAFKDAVRNERANVNSAFRTNKAVWGNDPTQLDFSPVFGSLNDVDSKFGSGSWISPHKPSQVAIDTASTRRALEKAVTDHYSIWRATGDPHLANALGFDDLKHNIDAIFDAAQNEQSKAAASIVRDSIKGELAKSTNYSEAMKNYAAGREALRAYNNELGISKDPDKAARVLFSTFRNNVTANFGRRQELVSQLIKNNPEARNAYYNLAGQANSTIQPRGFVGSIKTGALPVGALGAVLHPSFAGQAVGAAEHLLSSPWAWPILAAQSPKVMGHAALTAGLARKAVSTVPWRPLLYGDRLMFGHLGNNTGPQQ